MKLVEVTNHRGDVVEPDWLLSAEPVHRQLRQQLPLDYALRMRQVFANGARMVIVIKSQQVLGVAIWRLIENTYEGRRLYVDDLVTEEAHRSQGVGKLLLQHLEKYAHDVGCDVLALDSGTQRVEAHKFYFREGMTIASFSFRKSCNEIIKCRHHGFRYGWWRYLRRFNTKCG